MIQNKRHRKIIEALVKKYPNKEELILSDYDKYKKYKILMKNKNILFDSFFKKNIDFKAFESFSDKMSNTIIKNEARKLKKSILSNKYQHITNEKTDYLFLSLIENNIDQKVAKDLIGKKLLSFKYKTVEDFNSYLSNLVNDLISWDINNYLKNKIINKSDIIEKTNKTLLLEMNDIEKVKSYGSSMWCIKRDERYYKEYCSEGLRFYNYLDFSKKVTDKESQIAFVVNFNGQIVDAYFKNDENALSYVKTYLKEYHFDALNKQEIEFYLDQYNAINTESLIKKFLTDYCESLGNDYFIEYGEIPDELLDDSVGLDYLSEMGYPIWEYIPFERKNYLEIINFLHTDSYNIEKIGDIFSKNENDYSDEFLANCLYRKLKTSPNFTINDTIEIANIYKKNKRTSLFEIFFNSEFYELDRNKKALIIEASIKKEEINLEQIILMFKSTPPKHSDILFDCMKKYPEWEACKKQILNEIKQEYKSRPNNLKINNIITHLINNDETLFDFDEELIKIAYLRELEEKPSSIKESNQKRISKIIKKNKESYKDFFLNENNYLKMIKRANRANKKSFNYLFEATELFSNKDLEDDFFNLMKKDYVKINNNEYFDDFLNKYSNSDIRKYFFRTILNEECAFDSNTEQLNIVNEKLISTLLEEKENTLFELSELLNKKLKVPYGIPNKWKVDLFKNKIDKELLNRKNKNEIKQKRTL